MTTVIGIPPALDPKGRLRAGRATHYLDAALSGALHELGVVPQLLPGPLLEREDAAAALEAARAALAGVDGLLIPGGDDFVPEPAPALPLPLDPVAPAQLVWDESLARCALREGLPVLGICYGMQLLARLAGGRLIHHLPTERPEAAAHRLADDGRHAIRVSPGSRLAAMLDAEQTQVNSRHHQAVAEPGDGYRVVATAPDGIVEAIEADAARFVLGVQWHPEDMDAEHRRSVLGGFVAACRSAA